MIYDNGEASPSSQSYLGEPRYHLRLKSDLTPICWGRLPSSGLQAKLAHICVSFGLKPGKPPATGWTATRNSLLKRASVFRFLNNVG
ncbi:hypothetical protein AVEN_28920-1 [Araneus ventricosus]|uniref:Uncharacterized protein n=1 Tax=Araneus ventricosus TaxID=182803 RepID=A0A4Y2ALI7_ARAVE|nr:hypothetical protein AVEN_28920-1 [Araneus ventricosus]